MKCIGFIPDRNLPGLMLMLAALSLACAPAGRISEEIHIAEESAFIIWDAALKTPHFIHRASFETKAKDFSFIVPTPTVPKLAEGDDAAFKYLDRVITPPGIYHAVKKSAAITTALEAPKVEVIAKARVAGFDATVLSASDAGALDQ